MNELPNESIHQAVRERYGSIATSVGACGCSPSGSCCGGSSEVDPEMMARALGYSAADLSDMPEGANMGLGCGNPKAIAALKPGETVLDLGSGGGFDCFLAAREVGLAGRVIGVDMTAEMVTKARSNAARLGALNVEFRLGEIEHLPVADNSVDVIISNCVINLSPDKPQVFRDAFRVLKSGGRLAVADIVGLSPLPDPIKADLALHTACVAGAETIEHVQAVLEQVGFTQIRINPKQESREMIRQLFPGKKIEDYVVSADIEAVKP